MRRGVTLSTTAIASALASRSASACVSRSLGETTARAAVTFMAGRAAAGEISASAVALANEMLRSMLVTELRLVTIVLLLLSSVVALAGFVAQAKTRQAGKPDLPSSAANVDENAKPAPGRMFVTGRVLDAQGKPVPNASVMVYARNVSRGQDFPGDFLFSKKFGRTTTDGRGEIHVDLPRISSADHDEFGMVALAPGFGAGWVQLFADDEQPAAEITLLPERVIHGRLFELQGVPARNVKLSVSAIRRVLPPAPGARRESHEGPAFWWAHPDEMPGWPSPAVSDADGQFTVHGVGPGLRAFLTVIDSRFTDQYTRGRMARSKWPWRPAAAISSCERAPTMIMFSRRSTTKCSSTVSEAGAGCMLTRSCPLSQSRR